MKWYTIRISLKMEIKKAPGKINVFLFWNTNNDFKSKHNSLLRCLQHNSPPFLSLITQEQFYILLPLTDLQIDLTAPSCHLITIAAISLCVSKTSRDFIQKQKLWYHCHEKKFTKVFSRLNNVFEMKKLQIKYLVLVMRGSVCFM